MKSVLFIACCLLGSTGLFANPMGGVSEKVKELFHKTFKKAEKVIWTEEENVYSVRFTQNEIPTYIKYDEKGNFLSSLRYYHADHLPVDIQVKLNSKYQGKSIFGVTEQVIGDEINYYVKLVDDNYWYTIKIDNYRQMEQTEKYRKAE